MLRKQFFLRGFPSLSLSLNVPGYPKSNESTGTFFRYCLNDFQYYLKAHRITLDDLNSVVITDEAGEFFIASVTSPLHSDFELKQICEEFEESFVLGRFIDADLTDRNGNPVSSGKAKMCFYCNKMPANECRREKRHDPEELRAFMFSAMDKYCDRQHEDEICRYLAGMALKAILYEISLTPKPGLVDKFNRGSHTDMDYNLFLDSTVAISAYFADLAREGYRFRGRDLTRALPIIRRLGLRMETAMYGSTQHVNTQKGIIFLMGVSLFAGGYMHARKRDVDAIGFREIIKQVCHNLTNNELGNRYQPEKSHGEKMFIRHRTAGARGEAEHGFPMVFEFGLPELLKYQVLNDEGMIKAFLSIAAQNNDTNILYRSSPEVLGKFKLLSSDALHDFNKEKFNLLVDYCKQENISPGGSADLLSICIFVYLILKQDVAQGLIKFIPAKNDL